MSQTLLDRIAVVLVEPLYPGNVGSTARAMKNFGLRDLRLVHPPLDRGNEARRMACGSLDILDNARQVFTLDEALDDIEVVVGTTARLGGWRHSVRTPRQAAPDILELAQNNRVALLFGSEDRGLSNEFIQRCQILLNIPSSPAQSSLNLSHAVLLVCYELFSRRFSGEAHTPRLAPAERVEDMYRDLMDALTRINFLRPGNPEYWIMAFRRLLGRTGLTEKEVNLFRGICRQIRWVHGLALPNMPQSKAKNTPSPPSSENDVESESSDSFE